MEQTKYIVTYLGDYLCGHRHTLRISMEAHDALEAIAKSQAALTDDRLTSTHHSLFSVMPEAFSEKTITALNQCSDTSEVKS
ncbi:hypothetical protein [Xenorhabdus hominickii]|uniref:Uncharacterized protein n=1 Tax=Xenorhabdus hominickii TaxID=351679 RepID=A0A2G0Q3Z7_XENHO|nr:hypothetical protein [Xenorhabdus hominickii]AOM42594.1 hypothetical protein A9255_19825 [Xenorhabdus hominickii]PHM52244.1 hypothetical protein Xhom_04624 [Xenorhabdus hominickii]PHM53948.1 hypothetical protein Xhom_03016 [Xenorhabdus hominickii]